MKKLVLLIVVVGLMAGCATISPRHVAMHSIGANPAVGSFVAEAFFVLEFEHDPNGVLVHAASYGPTDSEFKATQDAFVRRAKVQDDNPPGFTSQFTVQHVKFIGPLGPKGAVVTQPVAANHPAPPAWVLFATDFDAHGAYLGSEMLHAVSLALTCQHQAHDIIDSTPRSDSEPYAVPPGASLLIYCVPVPPLPTATTLPNGDSVL
jgi:hypothetical protein